MTESKTEILTATPKGAKFQIAEEEGRIGLFPHDSLLPCEEGTHHIDLGLELKVPKDHIALLDSCIQNVIIAPAIINGGTSFSHIQAIINPAFGICGQTIKLKRPLAYLYLIKSSPVKVNVTPLAKVEINDTENE